MINTFYGTVHIRTIGHTHTQMDRANKELENWLESHDNWTHTQKWMWPIRNKIVER
jgi:hypothetical protein